MTCYVVRGPNWKILIKMKESFDDENYEYVEAATQAIEHIYSDSEDIVLNDDHDTPKFTAVIQVARHEHDIPIPIPDDESTEELNDLANIYLRDGYIRFLSTPLLLANAGRYDQAEFLKGIIEKDS